MSTFNGKGDNILFKCGACDNETLEVDLSNNMHMSMLWGWLQQHSAKGGSYNNIPIEREYVIFACKNCKKQLSEDIMGSKCPECGTWTYESDCRQFIKMRI